MSIANVVAKLNSEMDQHKNDSYVQVVGSYLVAHLDKYPQDAAKIAADEKTIVKSLDEMKKAASKKKVGNCAVLAPQEGFAIVMKYFGITESDGLVVPAPHRPAAPARVKASDIDFNVSLADLL